MQKCAVRIKSAHKARIIEPSKYTMKWTTSASANWFPPLFNCSFLCVCVVNVSSVVVHIYIVGRLLHIELGNATQYPPPQSAIFPFKMSPSLPVTRTNRGFTINPVLSIKCNFLRVFKTTNLTYCKLLLTKHLL